MLLERLNRRKKITVIFIAVSTLIITYLHYSTLQSIHNLHNIFTELYYVPLVAGALVFGLKGAVLTYIFVSALYFPYIAANWTNEFSFVANKLLHAIFSGAIALVTGVFVDREKRLREQTAKDRYLAGLGQASAAIVHDLKNPLLSIVGFARRIREGKGSVDTASDAIMSSAEDMQAIVHDVLEFARPIKLDFHDVDMRDVITKAHDYCVEKAGQRGITISVSLPAETPVLEMDGSHMERALINLINNAIEASKEGESVVVRGETNSETVRISIRDYGSGMDKETLDNIFIPFYTKKSYGTGLGMAIAKKIIEGHKGSIHIDSRVNAGTEVVVELPRT